METKHTKGEWEIRSNRIFIKDSYTSIADVHIQKSLLEKCIDTEQIANSKLISASPDLLDALVMVKQWADEFGMGEKYYNQVINAINKATL